MTHLEFQLRGLDDLRLAVHATSAQPAWLWSIDGTHILWANPVGAGVFGASHAAALAQRRFGPADPHRRQIAQLATRLPLNGAIRLERLRGFGAPLGTLATCGCTRLDFSDGSQGILVVAQANGRTMPLVERLQRLVEGLDRPIAAFASDGLFAGASAAARPLLGFRNLKEAGLDEARHDALAQGRVETPIGIGHMVLQRVGSGADVGLIALIAPHPAASAPSPCTSDAGIELIDPFAEEEAPDVACDATAPAMAQEEPPPSIEPVADEPAMPEPNEPPEPHRHPLRFTWQIDDQGCFSLQRGEFTTLIGPRTASALVRPWPELAARLGLDPDGRVMRALATRNTWSGITLDWPVDGGGRLPIELSGLPVFDHLRRFAGYRGFGVCRDLEALTRLAAQRRHSAPPSADIVPFEPPPAAKTPATPDQTPPLLSGLPARVDLETAPSTDLERPVETPPNVVPFRPPGETKPPTLTPVENHAFDEIARQLSARLENGDDAEAADEAQPALPEAPPSALPVSGDAQPDSVPAASARPDWLAAPERPAHGETQRDRMLLDLVPSGILIYRFDRLLYANAAFLKHIGYASLHALEEGGGLDALYVEPGVSSASSTSEAGTPMTISAQQRDGTTSAPLDARLFTISWDGDSALALICAGEQAAASVAATMEAAPPVAEPAPPAEPAPAATAGHADAEDLAAILDTTAEGIVMFDAEGNIHACNRSAEALFGYDGKEFAQRNLFELFAPESQRVVQDYLAGLKGADAASLLEHGRDVLGRERKGGIIPLSMTMGRTRADGPNFFAVFREQSHGGRPSESEPRETRQPANRAANAKADLLARISHEIRAPLNAIIGFAEVMIGERFGALGSERYVEYMKDIRASGERVIAFINDLTELSRIETGQLDLAFASQNLNDLVEQCVAVMQPQANRARIIIRTSLAQALPPVVADARALRQIALNLIGSSIHLANAGGQVIVSTALSDSGDVVLRVRDTGQGLNDSEIASALAPFRATPPSDHAADGSAFSLSLTKALVEANRAQFHIKSGAHTGTLVEVVFSQALAGA
ncbi:PAS domain-containing protein [Bradyrhizobium sp. NP1]|uniref:PAS domain-containing protein n=1 Tax=Bradyrhizobium sp. NP1 TaxID=3049772 RepID=UPI0025A6483C|nr:PAS domain-containing protein [Bradyrhizobium sp. NP1]WJR77504.1 PAS domain-containing protein [Bradyrhizobium sp. NP1]